MEHRLPHQISFYRGKVRDVYHLEGGYLLMVASDRLSAFDVILPRPIPYKGQVLNQMAFQFLSDTRHIVPNWALESPFASATFGLACTPIRVEMVVRGYLAGHAARVYASGLRTLCGVPLPEGLRDGDLLPNPIITPTTKAEQGHDEDASRETILASGLVSEAHYAQMESYALQLFEHGTQFAKTRGLLLCDTKYEFGLHDGKVMLMDEVHTPDSSRYYLMQGYQTRQAAGMPQLQLSKEFVRQWLLAQGFSGHSGQEVPEMSDAWVETVSHRYRSLFEQVMGKPFVPDTSPEFADLEAYLTARLG